MGGGEVVDSFMNGVLVCAKKCLDNVTMLQCGAFLETTELDFYLLKLRKFDLVLYKSTSERNDFTGGLTAPTSNTRSCHLEMFAAERR